MHTHSLQDWRHDHRFLDRGHEGRERRTWLVVALTLVTMVAEIIAGSIYGSMALTADGWRMSTHAAALAIAAVVSDDPQPPAAYKAMLAGIKGLSHVTIEVNPCAGHPPRLMAA